MISGFLGLHSVPGSESPHYLSTVEKIRSEASAMSTLHLLGVEQISTGLRRLLPGLLLLTRPLGSAALHRAVDNGNCH